MEDGARGGRGLQPAVRAHPQPTTGAPAASRAAARAAEPLRPPKSTQALATGLIVGKPAPKLLVGPRVVAPADRARLIGHTHRLLHSSRDEGCLFWAPQVMETESDLEGYSSA